MLTLKRNFVWFLTWNLKLNHKTWVLAKKLIFSPLQKCGHATEHVFIPSFLSMKLLHKIVEIYASIKGLHELQTKYCHNVCASFSPRIQGTINIKGISLFTIFNVRRFHTLILFFKSSQHYKIIIKTGPGCMGM